MNERAILWISLCCSGIGLLVLAVLSMFSDIPSVPIAEIETISDESTIQIQGTIERLQVREKIAYATISQECTIPVLIFNPEDLVLTEGDYVSITGKVQQSVHGKELVAEEIELMLEK